MLKRPALYIPVLNRINIDQLHSGGLIELVLELPEGATPQQIDLFKRVTDCSESPATIEVRIVDHNDVNKGIYWIDFEVPGEDVSFIVQVSECGNKELDFVAFEPHMIPAITG